MGSRPSAPVTYRPTPTAPTIYQSVIPDKDYENLSKYVDELKAERQKKKSEREAQGIGGAAFKKRLDLSYRIRLVDQNNNKTVLPAESLPRINIFKETLKLYGIKVVDRKFN